MDTKLAVTTNQPVSFAVAPPMYLATELREMRATGEYERLSEIAKREYTWYASEHRSAAAQHVDSLMLAAQMSLSVQVALHAEQVIYWLTTDLAARTYALAHYKLGYNGEITCRPYELVPGQTFREVVVSNAERQVEWVFEPIERFSKVIPLDALKAMKRLADEWIAPEAFWVADKIETVFSRPMALPAPSRSRSVDPILCAQFGTWLAGFAMWL